MGGGPPSGRFGFFPERVSGKGGDGPAPGAHGAGGTAAGPAGRPLGHTPAFHAEGGLSPHQDLLAPFVPAGDSGQGLFGAGPGTTTAPGARLAGQTKEDLPASGFEDEGPFRAPEGASAAEGAEVPRRPGALERPQEGCEGRGDLPVAQEGEKSLPKGLPPDGTGMEPGGGGRPPEAPEEAPAVQSPPRGSLRRWCVPAEDGSSSRPGEFFPEKAEEPAALPGPGAQGAAVAGPLLQPEGPPRRRRQGTAKPPPGGRGSQAVPRGRPSPLRQGPAPITPPGR